MSTAADLKGDLSRLLHETAPVTLDAIALRTIDTAGIQVIASFLRERAASALPVQWHGVAAPLLTAAHLLGLTALLQLPAPGSAP